MKKKYLAILLLIAAAVCAGIGLYRYQLEQNAGAEYEEIREEVVRETLAAKPKATEKPEKNKKPKKQAKKKKAVEIPIDFAALQNRNPEAYAWLKVPGTSIDYPILQSGTENAYYLSHTIDHENRAEGAIFTENYNTKTFQDPNTVIYGHDMKNGSMFQTLHNYMDRSFFDQNKEVIIYLPDQILHYRIFAAYLYDNRHLLQSFDFNNQEVFEQYLNSIFSMRDMNSFVDTDVDVDGEDRIITMSTCYAGISTQRYLVQAVLESIEE